MAFEKVKELNADTTVKLQNKGDSIEGFYHGYKEIPSKFGRSLLHIFELSTGENVGVWGSSRLNYGLKALTPKNNTAIMLRVTCDGTIPSNKGNDAYSFSIEKDKSRTTEAAVLPIEESAGAEESVVQETSNAAVPYSFKGQSRMVVDEDQDDANLHEILDEPVVAPSRVTNRPVTTVSAANKEKVNKILGVGRNR